MDRSKWCLHYESWIFQTTVRNTYKIIGNEISIHSTVAEIYTRCQRFRPIVVRFYCVRVASVAGDDARAVLSFVSSRTSGLGIPFGRSWIIAPYICITVTLITDIECIATASWCRHEKTIPLLLLAVLESDRSLCLAATRSICSDVRRLTRGRKQTNGTMRFHSYWLIIVFAHIPWQLGKCAAFSNRYSNFSFC